MIEPQLATLGRAEMIALLLPTGDAEALSALLSDVRALIAEDLAVFLECNCEIDIASGEPIRWTLTPGHEDYAADLERMLARLDGFLPGEAA